MATKIKDSATAQKAALNLNRGIEVPTASEPNAPVEKGTTERLFPDFMTSDGGIVNRPVEKEVPVPMNVTETPVTAPQAQTPPTQAPTAPTYLKLEELAGKMVKLKVDGIEEDVPASDLVKLKQLERHSNAQLMKIAQERAQLERERQELMTRPVLTPESQKKQDPPIKKSAEVEALEARLVQMEQSMMQERALLLPQIQEAGVKRVEQMIKDRTGFDDYRSYHDRVKEAALAEAQKAQAAGDMNAVKFFDSDAFYSQKYQELKLKDLSTKAPVSQPPSVPQVQQGAPVLVNNAGQPVSIPSFESSSGVPSTPSDQGNWQSTYDRLKATFLANPTEANSFAMIQHKFRRDG